MVEETEYPEKTIDLPQVTIMKRVYDTTLCDEVC
jgi:hypothetical protein